MSQFGQRQSGFFGNGTNSGGSVTSVGLAMPSPAENRAYTVTNSPVTGNGTLTVTANGTTSDYVRGDGSLASFPSLTGFVPYTGATADVNLGNFSFVTNKKVSLTATDGSGYLQSAWQSASPSGVASTTTMWFDATGRINWRPSTGALSYIRTFDATGVGQDSTWILPNIASTILAGLAVTQTFTGVNTFNPSVTASGAIARGVLINPALTAAANSDFLVALDIAPTFTNGAFTSVSDIGIRSQVASGTGKYNLYISGTASNLLAGTTYLSTSSGIVRVNDTTNAWQGGAYTPTFAVFGSTSARALIHASDNIYANVGSITTASIFSGSSGNFGNIYAANSNYTVYTGTNPTIATGVGYSYLSQGNGGYYNYLSFTGKGTNAKTFNGLGNYFYYQSLGGALSITGNLYGFRSVVQLTDTAAAGISLTSLSDIILESVSVTVGTGTITNRYGLNIAFNTANTTNAWGVYQIDAGVKNYFNGNTLFGSTTDNANGKVQITGNLALEVSGNKINIATGTNASLGTSGAMVAGTITISTTAVTTNSKIQLTNAAPAGTIGILSVGTIVNGTSFVINSSSALDTSTVNWWIVN